MSFSIKNSSGQALLIVLLSMSVVLTVVLSILSFSVTDIAITSREEEAQRAFSAAEAGVENVLLNPSTGIFSSELADGSTFSGDVSGLAIDQSVYIYPDTVPSGESATLHFVSYDTDNKPTCGDQNPCFTGNNLRVCWGNADDPPAAIETTFHYTNVSGDYSSIQIARDTFDPNSARRASNNFKAPSSTPCNLSDKEFAYQTDISLTGLGVNTAGLLYATIKPLYTTARTPLAFDISSSGQNFPSQGFSAQSTGSSGEALRKIEIINLHSEVPWIFDSAFFSSLSGISK